MCLWCLFLSTHLHNPCLGRRGHDLSDDDNIMGLWLILKVHGQVVAHIGKDIGVVVLLYVLESFTWWLVLGYSVPQSIVSSVVSRRGCDNLCRGSPGP